MFTLIALFAQLVDTVRELKREDEVVSSDPTHAAVDTNYQISAVADTVATSRAPKVAGSADEPSSHIVKQHLDQFLSELRLEDPSVADPYKYHHPRTNASRSTPCEPESMSGSGKNEAIAPSVILAARKDVGR